LIAGAFEDRRWILALFDDRVHDGGRRVLHVVTDQDRAGKREVDVGPHVLHRFARQAFESAHVVILTNPTAPPKKSGRVRGV